LLIYGGIYEDRDKKGNSPSYISIKIRSNSRIINL
jgi:hypothetical protein